MKVVSLKEFVRAGLNTTTYKGPKRATRIIGYVVSFTLAGAIVVSAAVSVPVVISTVSDAKSIVQSSAFATADKVMELGTIDLDEGTVAAIDDDKKSVCGENYAFLGVDSREGMDSEEVLKGTETGMRSDTQMFFNTNADCSQSNLVSIMRDYWVPIPCRNNLEAKFNSAFSEGGVQCTLETIKQTISLDPSSPVELAGVAVIDFAGFEKAIDLIGCIMFEAEEPFVTQNMPGYEVKKGLHEYCGLAALAIARERYSFDISDYMRIQLQRQIIFGALDKLAAMPQSERIQKAYMLAGFITTSDGMGVEKLLDLFDAIQGTEWNQGVLPTDGTGERNNGDGLGVQSVVLVDYDRLAQFQQALAANDLAGYLKAPENQKHW